MTGYHLISVTVPLPPGGSVGGARWRQEDEPSHDRALPAQPVAHAGAVLKPGSGKHELLPRLPSCSLLPGLAGVCVVGQVDRFGNVSCACLELCLL